MTSTLEVILVPAPHLNKDHAQLYFVEIKGMPYVHGKLSGTLVVSNAMTLAKAETSKREIEDALDAYRRPKRPKAGKALKRPKTSWARVLGGD